MVGTLALVYLAFADVWMLQAPRRQILLKPSTYPPKYQKASPAPPPLPTMGTRTELLPSGPSWRLCVGIALLAFCVSLSTSPHSTLLPRFTCWIPFSVMSSHQPTAPAPLSLDSVPHQLLAHIENVILESWTRQVGRQDFALSSDGARIVHGLTTTTGAPSSDVPHPATVVLRNNMHGGRCWLIPAFRGQVGISLSEPIYLTHVTIDHIPLRIAEATGRDAKQAPRSITVWAKLEDDAAERQYSRFLSGHPKLTGLPEGGPYLSQGYKFVPLVNFQYDIHSSRPTQTFPIHEELRALQLKFDLIVFEFTDNWGADSTCIYRVRVHGHGGGIADGVTVGIWSS